MKNNSPLNYANLYTYEGLLSEKEIKTLNKTILSNRSYKEDNSYEEISYAYSQRSSYSALMKKRWI